MPTLIEKAESRRLAGDTIELLYSVIGTADERVVRQMAEGQIPPESCANLVRQPCDATAVWVDENAGDGLWDVTVRYSPVELRDTGASQFSFDTTGGTQHITQGLAAGSTYVPAGQTAPDFRGAIGVTSDSVEGCDIAVPV